MKKMLTLAIPKGKLGEEALSLLKRAGLPWEGVATEDRQLIFTFPREGFTYLICRPVDVPTYVEHGAADLGIAGKDVLAEARADVFELLDLGFGFCRMVVAVPRQRWEEARGKVENLLVAGLRVATKYPRVAAEFFHRQGKPVEIIKLYGNIELAPQAGLADVIVDIVSTGRTLKENNLVEVVSIFSSTARLIANRVSYRMAYNLLEPVIEALKKAAEERRDDLVARS
ncbi:MAG TPA: ATP phosphoribosyltransferase [Moorella mulderi]|nr:ATP phosphoribosyltransferase [Moorella mulderi]